MWHLLSLPLWQDFMLWTRCHMFLRAKVLPSLDSTLRGHFTMRSRDSTGHLHFCQTFRAAVLEADTAS